MEANLPGPGKKIKYSFIILVIMFIASFLTGFIPLSDLPLIKILALVVQAIICVAIFSYVLKSYFSDYKPSLRDAAKPLIELSIYTVLIQAVILYVYTIFVFLMLSSDSRSTFLGTAQEIMSFEILWILIRNILFSFIIVFASLMTAYWYILRENSKTPDHATGEAATVPPTPTTVPQTEQTPQPQPFDPNKIS